jgi:hypothetical protein
VVVGRREKNARRAVRRDCHFVTTIEANSENTKRTQFAGQAQESEASVASEANPSQQRDIGAEAAADG